MASNAKIIGDLIAADSSVAIPGDGVILASDLADGSVTTAKLADANVTFDKIATTVPLGTKNLIINGDMRISQRGTSFTGIASNANYTLDRFQLSASPSTSAWTVTQSTDVPTGQGFATSMKCDCTTAFTSYTGGQSVTITHIVEAQNLQHLKVGTPSAESLTVSFWVKSNVTGDYVTWLYTPDGTARHTNKVFTINSADTWEKKTITISGDTSGTINNDNGHGMYLRVILASGSGYTSGTSPNGVWEDASATTNWYAGLGVNVSSSTSNYINITGVQLEVGENATPFEYRMYSQELALCQRYYEKSYNYANAPGSVSSADREEHYGSSDSGNNSVVGTSFKVTKRLVPTMKYYRDDTGALGDWLYARSGVGYTNTTVTNYTTTESSWRAYMGVGASYDVVISKGHWTADAEL